MKKAKKPVNNNPQIIQGLKVVEQLLKSGTFTGELAKPVALSQQFIAQLVGALENESK